MICPAGTYFLLDPVVEDVSSGGIIKVGEGTDKIKRAKIIDYGSDVLEYRFTRGETVFYSIFGAEEIVDPDDGKKYLLVPQKEIRAIYQKKK